MAGASLPDPRARSVPEVTNTREHHRNSPLIGSLNNLRISNRATWLNNRGRTRIGRCQQSVGKWEKCVAAHHAIRSAIDQLPRPSKPRCGWNQPGSFGRLRFPTCDRPQRTRSHWISRASTTRQPKNSAARSASVGARLVTTFQVSGWAVSVSDCCNRYESAPTPRRSQAPVTGGLQTEFEQA